MRHFLKETDFDAPTRERILEDARELKAARMDTPKSLGGQSWGMLFFKKSTRTRVSFEVGLSELGAHPVILSSSEMQISRGETVADTARVLSRYLHGLVIRCFEHEVLEGFVAHGSVPVVNALSDLLHPCQIYSDFFTVAEKWAQPGQPLAEALKGRKLVFYGDTACNMANSLILGGAAFGMNITVSGPESFHPQADFLKLLEAEGFSGSFTFETDPAKAAEKADVLYTDVWVSMGKEEEEGDRLNTLKPYQVSESILAHANADALFMHCLPAHAGHEVTQAVLDNPRSIIFDQAENRLHMQKAILAALQGMRDN